jgi:hypothetical protein
LNVFFKNYSLYQSYKPTMSKMSIQLAPLSLPTQSVTPRATHVSSPETLRDSDSEYDSDSDTEYVDADKWFDWFKTTDEYKTMISNVEQVPVKPVLMRSTNLMGNTGKQEPEPEDILPLV